MVNARRSSGHTQLVSHTEGSPTTAASGSSSSLALSARGRYVAFSSSADDLLTGTFPAGEDFYLASIAGLFSDGFESGDISAWSATVP